MYRPEHFILQEYVPRHIFNKWGETAWEFIDERLLRMDDLLREKFGPITINNWHVGGDREWSGLRTPGSPFYSPTSQHSFGRASDKLMRLVSAEEVRQYILSYPHEFPHIGGIEIDTPWLHTDVRNHEGIKTFSA